LLGFSADRSYKSDDVTGLNRRFAVINRHVDDI
jgi:hypothetical protein